MRTEKYQCSGCKQCGIVIAEDIINHTFSTFEVAYDMYVRYAKYVGFGVWKGDFVKTKDDCYSKQKFFCNRVGLREKKYYDNRVKNLFDEHNHDLVPQCMVHLILNHRQLTNANKAQADIIHMYGVPTSQIMGFMAGQGGGYVRADFTKKDLDNHLDRSRWLRILGGDANATISYLFEKADVDPMAMARYSSTATDRLGSLFSAEGICRADKYKKPLVIFSGSNHHKQTCIFGFAILDNEMTSTYKWLLANFLEVMMNKHPKVVVTDADEAMKENVDEFEEEWSKLVEELGGSDTSWIDKQYENKESSILELVENLERALRDYRNNEMVAQFKTSNSDPVLTTGWLTVSQAAKETLGATRSENNGRNCTAESSTKLMDSQSNMGEAVIGSLSRVQFYPTLTNLFPTPQGTVAAQPTTLQNIRHQWLLQAMKARNTWNQ
nr:protein FAR-RED IMPAIRED RESPONSE 1-like [Arachis hypogaea]